MGISLMTVGALCAPGPAAAGVVYGRVYAEDPGGWKPLPNTRLEVVSPSGRRVPIDTDSDGRYSAELSPDIYCVEDRGGGRRAVIQSYPRAIGQDVYLRAGTC